jgi:hypothetical protein
MNRRRLGVALSLSLALSLCPLPSEAAPAATEKAAAEALFEEGTSLVEKGELKTGCEKLAASQELDPALGTVLRLGDCYDRLGRTASAWASFKQAAAMARASSQPDREAIANERVVDLEARLSRLKLVVAENAANELQIKLGGVVIPPASWGSPLPVDPGVQHVEASAPGHQTWSTDFQVATGSASSELEIPALEPSPVAAADPRFPAPVVDPERDAARPGSGQRTFGYVLGGVGLAALATGGVFAYLAYDKNEESLEHCLRDEPNACSIEGKSLRDDAASHATIASIGVGAGAGLLLTGVVLLLTAPSGESAAGASRPVSLSARVSHESMRLSLSGAF